ncbi:MAG: hypothetical protein GX854_02740 [Clostridiales bacterium]|nr:hypothetical protein [Clostridiales bacterium]
MKKINIFFPALLTLLFLFILFIYDLVKTENSALSVPFSYNEGTAKGKVFLISIDRIGLSHLHNENVPNLRKAMDMGGVALMTTNTGGSRSQRDAYLTMGAGTKVAAATKSPLSIHTDEIYQGYQGWELYRQITGKMPPQDAIVNLGFAQSVRNNINKSYTVTIGALGKALREAGIIPAVIGNSDTVEEKKRYMVSFLMDENGIVPKGAVHSGTYTADKSRPFGIRTDYGSIMEYIETLWDFTDVFAIELGDTSRAEDFSYLAADTINLVNKKLALHEADAFIGELMSKLDFNRDMLIIASFLGSVKDLSENNRLAPVIILGPGYSNSLLTSASTRRPGIITNLDIGATLLDFYGASKLVGQLGNRIFSSGARFNIEDFYKYNKRLIEVNNHRTPLLRSYAAILVIMLVISLLCIFYFRKLLSYAAFFIQFQMAVPVAYLLLPLFHRSSLVENLIFSWLLALVITIIISAGRWGEIVKVWLYSMITVLLLIIDQITGAHLISCSPLGYDLINGSRYYGIGNEYMGILVGAFCLGIGSFFQICVKKRIRIRIWQPILLFFPPLMILSHPRIGANVGGTIAAIFGFASFILLLYRKSIKLTHFFFTGIITIVFLTVIFLFDYIGGVDTQSHMGQTVNLIMKNGSIELLLIVKRKIEMNIRLIRYTVWTRVFLLSLLTMVLLLFRPAGIFKHLAKEYPYFIKGITSGMIGCIAALLANDSGIVAAGTCMIFLAPPILIMIIGNLPDRINRLPWERLRI